MQSSCEHQLASAPSGNPALRTLPQLCEDFPNHSNTEILDQIVSKLHRSPDTEKLKAIMSPENLEIAFSWIKTSQIHRLLDRCETGAVSDRQILFQLLSCALLDTTANTEVSILLLTILKYFPSLPHFQPEDFLECIVFAPGTMSEIADHCRSLELWWTGLSVTYKDHLRALEEFRRCVEFTIELASTCNWLRL